MIHYKDVASTFMRKGFVNTLIGGQFGSEAKGSASAWLAYALADADRCYDVYITNAGAQAGHTSVHDGKKRVVFHLPTAPLIAKQYFRDYGMIYINAGSIIDVDGLLREIEEQGIRTGADHFAIHPHAAIITDECREAENQVDSSQTKTASTRKGVGQALARKVLRSGMVAKDCEKLQRWVRPVDLNRKLLNGNSVLMEVPQGVSLSLNHSPFYPYTTSRDCTPMAGLSDAGIHPVFMGKTMVVLRTFPIRVGNIMENGEQLGYSGDSYADQEETTWEAIGVEPEITTVTKRVRRVFTFSKEQAYRTFMLCRPEVVMLTFANYCNKKELSDVLHKINAAAEKADIRQPEVLLEWGPSTEDIKPWPL